MSAKNVSHPRVAAKDIRVVRPSLVRTRGIHQGGKGVGVAKSLSIIRRALVRGLPIWMLRPLQNEVGLENPPRHGLVLMGELPDVVGDLVPAEVEAPAEVCASLALRYLGRILKEASSDIR